jgi:hypothetical protein
MMLKKSIIKITFLSAFATLIFVFWNAELMRQDDYYDERYDYTFCFAVEKSN